jgi:hypothetical protein
MGACGPKTRTSFISDKVYYCSVHMIQPTDARRYEISF